MFHTFFNFVKQKFVLQKGTGCTLRSLGNAFEGSAFYKTCLLKWYPFSVSHKISTKKLKKSTSNKIKKEFL